MPNTATAPSRPDFLRFALGPNWSLHARITDHVRARHPNPVRRREYDAAVAAYEWRFGKVAQ